MTQLQTINPLTQFRNKTLNKSETIQLHKRGIITTEELITYYIEQSLQELNTQYQIPGHKITLQITKEEN